MRKLVIISIIICLALAAPMAFSQDKKDAHSTLRIEYRIAMPGLWFGRGDDMKDDFTLEPENYGYLGIQYSTRGFSIGLSSNVMFGNENKLSDVFLSWFGEKSGFELFHQNYRNFYIARDDAEGKKYPDTPNEYPDLRVINTGLSGYWFFRENNYRGLSSQEETLLVNSWSPFMKATVGRYTLDNDDPLIPENLMGNYNKRVRTTNRADFHQLSVSVGITGTYTWSGMYIAGLITAGCAGINQQWETAEGKSYSGYALEFDIDFQAIAGYMEGDFFCGLWFINDNQWAKLEDLNIQLTNFQMSLFAGFRF